MPSTTPLTKSWNGWKSFLKSIIMKKVGLYQLFKDDLLGGGEINDNNLINHLESS